MNISAILLAMVVVGGTGLLIAILLGIASEKFKVPVDEKEVAIRAELPGNNCGGCGVECWLVEGTWGLGYIVIQLKQTVDHGC